MPEALELSTTTFYLIRHASCAHLGKTLAGRSGGRHLDEKGEGQARRLAERLDVPFAAIYVSPLERTLETAVPLAEKLRVPITPSEAIGEVDFGEWTGRDFDELDERPEWKYWNEFRSGTRPPGGERIVEVQVRVLRALEEWQHHHVGQNVAIVSHADVIKATLVFFLGMPIDYFHRLEISPASVSILAMHPGGPRLLAINATEP